MKSNKPESITQSINSSKVDIEDLGNRRIILKNKQRTYHPYCNPEHPTYKWMQEYAAKIAQKSADIASGKIKVLNKPLTTEAEFQAYCKRNRDAVSNRQV